MRFSTQSVAGQPVAASAPMPKHHGVVPVAAILLVSADRSGMVCGGVVSPAACSAFLGKYTPFFTFELMSTAYCLPSVPCPASSAPGTMLALRSSIFRTPVRSARAPDLAMSRMMPGWGNTATSGSCLPCTRVLMSWLKFAVGENFMLMPFFCAHGLTTAMKSSDCWPVKPYMISMLLLVLLPPLLPPPPPLLRQPVVRTATAPRTAVAVRLDLMRMALLRTQLGRRLTGTGAPGTDVVVPC